MESAGEAALAQSLEVASAPAVTSSGTWIPALTQMLNHVLNRVTITRQMAIPLAFAALSCAELYRRRFGPSTPGKRILVASTALPKLLAVAEALCTDKVVGCSVPSGTEQRKDSFAFCALARHRSIQSLAFGDHNGGIRVTP